MIPLQSENIEEIIKSLINAKAEFKPIIKDKEIGGTKKSKYASLGTIIEATDHALRKNGIYLEQPEYSIGNGEYYVITKLCHVSGQWIQSISPIILDDVGVIKQKNQQYGAALSYAKRYAMSSILNVHTDDIDVDDYDHKPTQRSYRDTEGLLTKLIAAGRDITKIKSHYKISDLKYLKQADYEALCKLVEQPKKEANV